MNLVNGQPQGFDLEHLIYTEEQPVSMIARLVRSDEQVTINNLPAELFHWLADNTRLHRGKFWIRQTAVPNGKNQIDIGCITPTLRVAEDKSGRRFYFEAFDIAHARDIIEDHDLRGFQGHRLRLKKVKHIDDVPVEDRDFPVYALLASGNRVRVADYGDLNSNTRYDRGEEPEIDEEPETSG